MTTSLSVIAILISIGNLVFYFRNSRRSQRIEFSQRRDQLLLRIADLSAKSADNHQISSRYGFNQLNLSTIPVLDEADGESHDDLRSDILEIKREIDLITSENDKRVSELYAVCGRFTSRTAPAEIDNLIIQVQLESDRLARVNGKHLALLHTFEVSDSIHRSMTANVIEFRKLSSELDQVKSTMKLEDPDQE